MTNLTGEPAVRVQNLAIQYGSRLVLDDITFEIPTGQNVAVLGPNGAGKSTMIEIMEGFRRPSGGDIRVLGQIPIEAPEAWKSRIGVVLQAWRDHGAWRVTDFLQYVAAAHHSAGRTDLWEPAQLLETVGLEPQAHQRIRALSGGQRRRVDVAAALIGRPEVLFLDEPTTGFDPEARGDFHALMASLASTTTIFWATHDLHEAQDMCERILILSDGRIIADGSPDDLRASMASKTTVSWRNASGSYRRELEEPRPLVAELAVAEDVFDVEVHRGSLEEAYLAIVNDRETPGDHRAADVMTAREEKL